MEKELSEALELSSQLIDMTEDDSEINKIAQRIFDLIYKTIQKENVK